MTDACSFSDTKTPCRREPHFALSALRGRDEVLKQDYACSVHVGDVLLAQTLTVDLMARYTVYPLDCI